MTGHGLGTTPPPSILPMHEPHGERPEGARTVDQLLEAARARLQRVAPDDLEREQAAGALVVDTRTEEQRRRDGPLPGAVVIDRTVLEWRLDPASPHRIDGTGYDRRIVLVCNEGYSSSLAAATLQDMGLHRATDLVGGFQALMRLRDGAPDRPAPMPG